MSQPIKICTIIKAAKGDQQSFDWLVRALEINAEHGAFTMFPCDHEPRCEKPTDEQMDALNLKMEEVMRERAKAKKDSRNK